MRGVIGRYSITKNQVNFKLLKKSIKCYQARRQCSSHPYAPFIQQISKLSIDQSLVHFKQLVEKNPDDKEMISNLYGHFLLALISKKSFEMFESIYKECKAYLAKNEDVVVPFEVSLCTLFRILCGTENEWDIHDVLHEMESNHLDDVNYSIISTLCKIKQKDIAVLFANEIGVFDGYALSDYKFQVSSHEKDDNYHDIILSHAKKHKCPSIDSLYACIMQYQQTLKIVDYYEDLTQYYSVQKYRLGRKCIRPELYAFQHCINTGYRNRAAQISDNVLKIIYVTVFKEVQEDLHSPLFFDLLDYWYKSDKLPDYLFTAYLNGVTKSASLDDAIDVLNAIPESQKAKTASAHLMLIQKFYHAEFLEFEDEYVEKLFELWFTDIPMDSFLYFQQQKEIWLDYRFRYNFEMKNFLVSCLPFYHRNPPLKYSDIEVNVLSQINNFKVNVDIFSDEDMNHMHGLYRSFLSLKKPLLEDYKTLLDFSLEKKEEYPHLKICIIVHTIGISLRSSLFGDPEYVRVVIDTLIPFLTEELDFYVAILISFEAKSSAVTEKIFQAALSANCAGALVMNEMISVYSRADKFISASNLHQLMKDRNITVTGNSYVYLMVLYHFISASHLVESLFDEMDKKKLIPEDPGVFFGLLELLVGDTKFSTQENRTKYLSIFAKKYPEQGTPGNILADFLLKFEELSSRPTEGTIKN